jgi:hypothetical protein
METWNDFFYLLYDQIGDAAIQGGIEWWWSYISLFPIAIKIPENWRHGSNDTALASKYKAEFKPQYSQKTKPNQTKTQTKNLEAG